MDKDLIIRNSTTEFLIFQSQSKEDSIEVKYADEMIWLSQKMMAKLFEVEINTINYHLKEIFKSKKLEDQTTIRKFRIVQTEGNRQVERDIEFYTMEKNLMKTMQKKYMVF